MTGFDSIYHSVIPVRLMVIIMLVAISVVALGLALRLRMDSIMSALAVLLRFVTPAALLASVEIIIAILIILECEIHLIVHPLVIALILIVEGLKRLIRIQHRQPSLASTFHGTVLRIQRILRFLFLAPASAGKLRIVAQVRDLVEGLQSALIIAKWILSLEILDKLAFIAALVASAESRVDRVGIHVVYQVAPEGFLLKFVFDDYGRNPQVRSS